MPPGAKSAPTLDDLAGGSAYQRFAQTILWLHNHGNKELQISSSMGPTPEVCDRTMRVLKARNGESGQSYGMRFDVGSLTLHEIGRLSDD
jgi:hypothetical protein